MHSVNRVVLAAAFLLAAASIAGAGDFLEKKDGGFNPALKSGGQTPAATDYEESSWQVTDATIAQKMPATEVLSIWLEPKKYGSNWKAATDAMAAGNFAQAAALFQSIGNDTRAHRVVRQNALLNAARALGGAGDKAAVQAAEAGYDALLKAFPQTFYLRALWKDRWQLRMEAGDYEGAKQAIAELLKIPGVSDADKTEADLSQNSIDLKEAVGKKDQAAIQKCLDRFKEIAGKTAGQAKFASVNAQARVGTGNCLLELGNASEAKGIFEDISEHATEKPVCAAAFNGLGECWFRQNDKAGFIEARRCFLRTQLLYSEGTSPEVIAKALYYSGECFYRLQDTDDWRDRAKRELSDCMRRFKSSVWADRARKLLPAIK
jgi:tetratricopeptide (TPR) repeat protein